MPKLPILSLWQKIAAACLIVGLLLALSYCQGRSDGSAAMQAKIATAQAKQAERNRIAQEKAAEQRQRDALANAKTMEERNALIAAAPGGVVSPADRALACDRLMRAGYTGPDLPVSCRPASGNRTQAAPVASNRH